MPCGKKRGADPDSRGHSLALTDWGEKQQNKEKKRERWREK